MKLMAALICLATLAGCTSSIGFGDGEGVGIRSSLGKDGKILVIEPTDGEGNPQQPPAP